MNDWDTLARALRRLHAQLLQQVRGDYERASGVQVGPGELLMLATRDANFAWLRMLSELMADIDHLRDLPAGQLDDKVRAVVRGAVDELLVPASGTAQDSEFTANYWPHVHRDPEAAMAHAAVKQALRGWPEAAGGCGHRAVVAERAKPAPRR